MYKDEENFWAQVVFVCTIAFIFVVLIRENIKTSDQLDKVKAENVLLREIAIKGMVK